MLFFFSHRGNIVTMALDRGIERISPMKISFFAVNTRTST